MICGKALLAYKTLETCFDNAMVVIGIFHIGCVTCWVTEVATQGMRNKIAMCFGVWGREVEVEGEKLLSAMLLLEGALKNSDFFTKEPVDEWKACLL